MAKQSSNAVSALKLLVDPTAINVPAVCVLVGDDGYLQHEARLALLKTLEADDSVEHFDGRQCELRDVLDALREMSLFGADRRVVVVEDAESFVKRYRAELEDYVVHQREAKAATAAVLILEVPSWPGNTRLAKATAESGLTVSCQTPEKGRELTEFNSQLKKWLEHAARQEFNCQLERSAADALLEQLPSQAGVLYQEVARLSLLAGAGNPIDRKLVQENVGGWRTRKTWDMIDAAADGNAAEALRQLDRLLAAGEEPHALLPQMASTLRRFALAVRLFEQAEAQGRKGSLRAALEQSGALKFKIGDMERQLRQIGRERARQLYGWLLAADLGLKGYNSTKDRARRVIETLIVQLAKVSR